ncbi:hypothetical protein LINPERHAP1_LOCUS4255 [Linum perenne]
MLPSFESPNANAQPPPVTEPSDRPPESSDTNRGRDAGKIVVSSFGSSAQTPPSDGQPRISAFRSYLGALEGPKAPSPSFQQPWIPVGEHDIIPQVKDGLRSLSLSKDFKAKLCKPWANTLVVSLIVHQWSPDFRVSDSLPAKMVVWVRFPLMPVQYYHAQILTSLGNLIGRTIKIDFNTQHAERGKFARLAVEIDLNEPLVPTIELDGCRQDVEYENLPALCFECGKVGHTGATCPLKHPAPALTSSPSTTVSPESPIRPPEAAPDSFGPWMIVTRKSRRPRMETGGRGIPKKSQAKIKATSPANKKGNSSKPANGNSSTAVAGPSKKQPPPPQTIWAGVQPDRARDPNRLC